MHARLPVLATLIWIVAVVLIFPSIPALADMAAEYGLLTPSTSESGMRLPFEHGMRIQGWNVLVIVSTAGLLSSVIWASGRLFVPRTPSEFAQYQAFQEPPATAPYGGVSPYELDNPSSSSQDAMRMRSDRMSRNSTKESSHDAAE